MKCITGINGFGRFGLHLLKYWLDRNQESEFIIKFINDDSLNIDQAIEVIKNDKSVIFNKYKIKKMNSIIHILEPNGNSHEIEFSNKIKQKISWLGKPNLFLECSGKNTMKKDCEEFIVGNTSHVLISATSWDADDTLIYGFNHTKYNKKNKIISYGSCTVNAFIPLGNFIEKKFGIVDADVNVIHNIQEYRMENNFTLNRKFCTLEKSAVSLLDSINNNNFIVNYTVVPYTGVSIIDYRFRLKKKISKEKFIIELEDGIGNGMLYGIYDMHEVDNGPEVHNCTSFSSVFIKENIYIINDQVYIFSYFDNENSVNRYFDLVNYISSK